MPKGTGGVRVLPSCSYRDERVKETGTSRKANPSDQRLFRVRVRVSAVHFVGVIDHVGSFFNTGFLFFGADEVFVGIEIPVVDIELPALGIGSRLQMPAVPLMATNLAQRLAAMHNIAIAIIS